MSADSRRLSNVGIKGRIRQMLILAAAILLGVIISKAVNGEDFCKVKSVEASGANIIPSSK